MPSLIWPPSTQTTFTMTFLSITSDWDTDGFERVHRSRPQANVTARHPLPRREPLSSSGGSYSDNANLRASSPVPPAGTVGLER